MINRTYSYNTLRLINVTCIKNKNDTNLQFKRGSSSSTRFSRKIHAYFPYTRNFYELDNLKMYIKSKYNVSIVLS